MGRGQAVSGGLLAVVVGVALEGVKVGFVGLMVVWLSEVKGALFSLSRVGMKRNKARYGLEEFVLSG